MIEVNLPNEMGPGEYDLNKPPYECWGEDSILNMHISPEEDQTFQIDVDKGTHELIISHETEHSVVVIVKPRGIKVD